MSKAFAGFLIFCLLLFLPAGTWDYSNGWLLVAILFIPMAIAGAVMAVRSPDLLKKRLGSKEKEGEQKIVVALSGLMFIVAFVLAGLDFRYGWSVMPVWTVRCAAVLFLAAYLMYAEVLRENAYLSRTI